MYVYVYVYGIESYLVNQLPHSLAHGIRDSIVSRGRREMQVEFLARGRHRVGVQICVVCWRLQLDLAVHVVCLSLSGGVGSCLEDEVFV